MINNPFNGTIEHSGFAVPDIEEAVDFFVKVLGFELLNRPPALEFKEDDRLTRYFGVHPRSVVRGAAFLQYGGRKIELVEWSAPDQQDVVLKPSDVGSSHLALTVSDLNVTIDYLKCQQGVQIREYCPFGFVYFTTPWGMEIQVLEEK
ncbi:VOC family protein [Clostridium sp. BL-8]|uniref:VOC family protein n=1 Tax=Clostridium sp. BL-8 TaxID=349938 RepID=UPI00098C667E|nr:VOC family protein [Clostridium sp. BL-8]OOM73402.1 glyoxalase/bleomycin resistance protein/dioxygenase superfamily protein [Clostridium sp. BL-8]